MNCAFAVKTTLFASLCLTLVNTWINIGVVWHKHVSEDSLDYYQHQHANTSNRDSIVNIVNGISDSRLLAMTFWDEEESDLMTRIYAEQKNGQRDRYFLPSSYHARFNNAHFVDDDFTDEYQKDVYLMAREIMRQLVERARAKEGARC